MTVSDFGVLSRVIPDGVSITSDGNISSYRVSIVFLPYPNRVDQDVEFDLDDWPTEIFELINKGNLRLFIAGDKASVDVAAQNPHPIPYIHNPKPNEVNVSIWADSSVIPLWQKIVQKLPAPGASVHSLAPSERAAAALKSAFKGKYVKPHANWPVFAVNTGALANLAKATRAAETIFQLYAINATPNSCARITKSSRTLCTRRCFAPCNANLPKVRF
jgi:hypothetical protein